MVSISLHLAAVATLLQLDAVRKPLAVAAPMMVNLITPKPEPPRVLPTKPPPAPLQQQRLVEPQPLLTVNSAVPSPLPIPQIPGQATAPQMISTQVTQVATAATVVPVTPAPVPEPEPVLPPTFDAAYLQNPPPAYPALSRRRGEQGRVVLRVLVSTQGAAQQVELRATSGSERLDHSAIDAVKQWRFVPAKKNNQAVPAWVLVPIDFSLGS